MDKLQLNSLEIEIIQFLFEHREDYMSSQKIADACHASSKTIRKYIDILNDHLKDYDAMIEMKKGSGFKLKITNKKFYTFLEQIREQEYIMDDSTQIVDASDRERFIVNILLLENRQVTIDELADELFVSHSTISSVIKQIKQKIEPYDLNLSYDFDGNIVISGEELNKRRFILSYFFASRQEEHYLGKNLFEFQDNGFSVETIFIIVLELCREFDIQLSDFVLQNLVLHIALAIKRNEKGFTINQLEITQQIDYTKELFVAEKIVDSIEQLIDIKFSDDEANYIALHLKSKSSNQEIIKRRETIDHQSLHVQIVKALLEIKKRNAFEFSLTQQLVKGIETHFEPLLTRLSLDIELKNPLLDEIKEKYSEVFLLTKEAFSKLPILARYQVDDHEIAYISLHVLAAIERYKQYQKVNVIVICATGLGSAQMLKSRLENTFSTNMNIVDVISYYQINDEMLQNIDLIITTLDISTSFYSVPVVKVSVFLNKSDIEKLTQSINRLRVVETKMLSTDSLTESMTLLFHQYFSAKRFFLFDSGVSREEVLNEMIQSLTDASTESFKETLLKQIHVREQFGTLAFTEKVAFPHPAQPVGASSEIALGVIPQGLKWDDEHQAVKVIVLISPSRIENEGLDIINKGLVEYISEEKKIHKLLEEASFDHFETSFMETLNV